MEGFEHGATSSAVSSRTTVASRSGAWCSCYVYYFEQHEDLILSAVEPLFSRLRRERLVDGYFFIRYMEGGPHIRVRARPLRGSEGDVREIFAEHFSHWLQSRPSDAGFTNIHLNFPNFGRGSYPSAELTPPKHSDNTFTFTDYEPEFDRYGGREGVAIAEENFRASTDIAFQTIRATQARLTSRLAVGLGFLLATVQAASDDPRAQRDILVAYSQCALKLANVGPTTEWRRAFDQAFERQQPTLVRQVEDFLARASSAEPLVADWRGALQSAAERWAEILNAPPPLSVLFSYQHMLNNRLGFPVPSEAYLAAQLSKALEALS